MTHTKVPRLPSVVTVGLPAPGSGDEPRGLPLITYAPRGRGGVKSPIHFHCVLYAKRGGGGPKSM